MNFLRRLALLGRETWWQLASRCGRNRGRPWLASELVSFLVGLRTYQHPRYRLSEFCGNHVYQRYVSGGGFKLQENIRRLLTFAWWSATAAIYATRLKLNSPAVFYNFCMFDLKVSLCGHGGVQLKCDCTRWRTGGEVKGGTGECSGEPVPFTLPRNMLYSALLQLMAHTSAASFRLNWRPHRADLTFMHHTSYI